MSYRYQLQQQKLAVNVLNVVLWDGSLHENVTDLTRLFIKKMVNTTLILQVQLHKDKARHENNFILTTEKDTAPD